MTCLGESSAVRTVASAMQGIYKLPTALHRRQSCSEKGIVSTGTWRLQQPTRAELRVCFQNALYFMTRTSDAVILQSSKAKSLQVRHQAAIECKECHYVSSLQISTIGRPPHHAGRHHQRGPNMWARRAATATHGGYQQEEAGRKTALTGLYVTPSAAPCVPLF